MRTLASRSLRCAARRCLNSRCDLRFSARVSSVSAVTNGECASVRDQTDLNNRRTLTASSPCAISSLRVEGSPVDSLPSSASAMASRCQAGVTCSVKPGAADVAEQSSVAGSLRRLASRILRATREHWCARSVSNRARAGAGQLGADIAVRDQSASEDVHEKPQTRGRQVAVKSRGRSPRNSVSISGDRERRLPHPLLVFLSIHFLPAPTAAQHLLALARLALAASQALVIRTLTPGYAAAPFLRLSVSRTPDVKS